MKKYSENFLSTAFEVDRGVANRCLRDVTPDETVRGRASYKIATFYRALLAHQTRNQSPNNDGAGEGVSDTGSLTAARVRIALANAESKERVNTVARGEFCDVPTAMDLFGLSMSVMRETMLSMPGKLADTLSAYCAEDHIKIFEIMHREVVEALTALSSPEHYAAAGVAFAQACDARAAPDHVGKTGL
jgi:hypothetical protein